MYFKVMNLGWKHFHSQNDDIWDDTPDDVITDFIWEFFMFDNIVSPIVHISPGKWSNFQGWKNTGVLSHLESHTTKNRTAGTLLSLSF